MIKNSLILLAIILMGGCANAPSLNKEASSGQLAHAAQSAENAAQIILPKLTPEDVPPPPVSWSDNVDFRALRETYGLRADFNKLCERNYPAKNIIAAYDANRFADGVDIASKWLNQCPVDARIHTLYGYGLHMLGDETTAEMHVRWAMGLTQSILDSGDGKTAKTAYVTISVSEEYTLLQRLGLTPKSQALLQGPPMVDALTTADQKGNERTVYFNPALHFVRLEALVATIKKKSP